jgi:cytochrome b561
MREEMRSYGPARRALHWASALIVFGLFPLGWYMTGLEFSDFKMALYDWHKWFGMTVLAFVLARLVLRRLRPVAPDPSLTPLERRVSGAAHAALYVLLVAIPLAGWAGSSALGFPVVWFGVLPLPDWVPENQDLGFALLSIHTAMTWALLALVVLHLAGVAYHVFVKRDGVLARMARGT